jgi:hypothetical protein
MDHSLSLLESSRGLRALHFSHTSFCTGNYFNKVDIWELGRHCAPLLRSLQTTCKARNVNLDVLDVVKIALPPCHCKLCPEPKKRCQYLACREGSIHEHCPFRVITTPGGGAYGETSYSCGCLCDDADRKNGFMSGLLEDEISRQLMLLDIGNVEA